MVGRSSAPGQVANKKDAASASDLLCVHCGYNLRGLVPDGRCPECGTLIARSIRGDLLSAADPAWLTRVSQGQTLIYAAFVTFLLCGIVVVVATGFVMGAFPGPSVTRTVFGFLVGALQAVPVILALLGIFRLIAPDPRLSLTKQPIVLRRIVCGAVIAALLLTALYFSFVETRGWWLTAFFPRAAVSYAYPLVKSVVPWAFGSALAFTWVAASLYLGRLGERIPDMELAKRTKSTARRFAVCFVLNMLTSAVLELNGYSTFLAIPLTLAQIIGVLGIWIYGISLIGKWSKYRKAIKGCLLEARRNAEG